MYNIDCIIEEIGKLKIRVRGVAMEEAESLSIRAVIPSLWHTLHSSAQTRAAKKKHHECGIRSRHNDSIGQY